VGGELAARIREVIEVGGDVGVSSRGTVDYETGEFRFETFDLVAGPSTGSIGSEFFQYLASDTDGPVGRGGQWSNSLTTVRAGGILRRTGRGLNSFGVRPAWRCR